MTPRILIAGIGNIFLGDDAFGVEVAQRLMRRPQPDGVRVADFGIRGLDLAYTLTDGWDYAVLIDAMPGDHPSGTLSLLEPRIDAPGENITGQNVPGENPVGVALDPHSMDPVTVLRAASSLGALPGRILVLGCQPGPLAEDEEMALSMSPAVSASVEPAVEMAESLIARILLGEFERTTALTPPQTEPAASEQEHHQW